MHLKLESTSYKKLKSHSIYRFNFIIELKIWIKLIPSTLADLFFEKFVVQKYLWQINLQAATDQNTNED